MTGYNEIVVTGIAIRYYAQKIKIHASWSFVIVGKVIRRVADDLYIDIVLKFHDVCKAPSLNNEFLDSSCDLTLLEADATLLRILYSPLGPVRPRIEKKQEPKESNEETKEELKTNE
ncbi:hypothetical protein PRIPAC_74676 [Pristionchus pacificus]|uniref:Mrps-28 n=1 Tax=Pristionchus pacificus TaxID=54126 RepID=A0A2A6BFP3_PRIPA|nr:hypothetical protein PRIPAC_74676 [Pristionchus pacificus]|eukprot:PDM64683.1 mrps-28 [Pristionchus pacificus]